MSSTCALSSCDLGGSDLQSQLGFGFGQDDPQLPPGAEFALRPPEPAHFLRSVAADQRIVVITVHGEVRDGRTSFGGDRTAGAA